MTDDATMLDSSETMPRWALVARRLFVGFWCLAAVVALSGGAPWYLVVGVLCGAAIIMVGARRILRPGVSRTPGEVVCRYLPWYEGSVYVMGLAIPLMGICMTAMGGDREYPVWFRFGGIFLVGVLPLILWGVTRLWRQSLLRISPSALAIRLVTRSVGPPCDLIEIPRERIESITPKIAPLPVNGRSLRAEITYRCVDDSGGSTVETVLLGLHLTVRPHNLVNALIAWNNATDHDDPNDLLDRVEHLLRGHPTAGRAHR